VTRTDKDTKKKIKETLARDVMFNRRVDGVNFAGVGIGGGVEIRFGNQGKVGSLRTVWRRIEPYKQVTPFGREQIIQALRSGKGVVDGEGAAKFQNILISSLRTYYFEKRWSEPQAFVYPYITMEAAPSAGQESVLITCPVCEQ